MTAFRRLESRTRQKGLTVRWHDEGGGDHRGRKNNGHGSALHRTRHGILRNDETAGRFVAIVPGVAGVAINQFLPPHDRPPVLTLPAWLALSPAGSLAAGRLHEK